MTDKIITLNKPADAAYIIWKNDPEGPRQLTEGQDYEFLSNYVIRFIGPLLTAGVFDFEDNIINISTLAYNYDAQNPAVLIDRRDNVVITEVPIWNPARQQYDPKAIYAVDFRKDADPARYNNKIETNTDPEDNFWDSRFVNKVWFDTGDEFYIPYDDKNLEPDLDYRLRNWGKLADFGEIRIYQWTESDVLPSQYDVLAEQEENDESIPLEQRKTGRSRKILYRNDGTAENPVWVKEEDQHFEIISDLVTNVSYPEDFSDLVNNPRPGAVEVYVNGILDEDETWFDQTTFKNYADMLGSKKLIHVIRKATVPSAQQIENLQYKFDTPYSVVTKTNNRTGNTEELYYFWVEDKLTKIKIKGGATSSITFNSIKTALQNISTPYLIPNNPIDLSATGFADIFITNSPRDEQSQSFEFPFSMNQVVIKGLDNVVSPDDRYVIRFTRDFTLRDKLKSYIVPTPTPSVTPTLTPTPSITPSNTLSATPTPTVSLTPTIGSSPTPTPSVTPTITLTPSVTPTLTPTGSLTPTPTSTPRGDNNISELQKKNVHWEWKLIREKQFNKIDRTLWNEIIESLVGFEYTGGPLEGPAVSLTPTPSPSPSPSPTPGGVTATPTPTPTRTRTPTLTPIPSATPTVTPSRTGTPIPPTPSSTVTPTRTPPVTLTPTPTPVPPEFSGASSFNVASEQGDPISNAQARIVIRSNGTIGTSAPSGTLVSNIRPSEWYPGAPVSGIGSDHEIEIVITSGSISGATGAGNWVSLSSNRTLSVGASGPGDSSVGSGTIRIRNASITSLVTSTFNFTLRADVDDGGLGPGGCFIAGSKLLLANGGYINIESAQKGQSIIGQDGTINEIVEVRTIPSAVQTLASINGGDHFVTDSHPILTTTGWKAVNKEKASEIHPELNIEQLEKGDTLIMFDHVTNSEYQKVINSISTIEKETVVYNLNVSGKDTPSIDGNDTYIVNGFIVHNK